MFYAIMKGMTKDKIHPRALHVVSDKPSRGFLYRLLSSQRFLAIIGLIFLVVIIFPLARTYSQRQVIEKELADVQHQIADFENQNQQLQELIAYLQTDQSLEEQARLNLNLKKPGEGVIVVENKSLKVDKLVASSTVSVASNFQKWLNYFFN